MTKGIYIATLEAHSGKSILSIGLMQHALGIRPKVAYFRPVIEDLPDGERDNHIDTMLSYFNLEQPYDSAYVFGRSQLIAERNAGREIKVIDAIIAQYKHLETHYDFVVVEGSDFLGEGTVFEFDFNVTIAKNLGIPALLIRSGVGKNMEEFAGSLRLAYHSFVEEDVQVLAVVANKIMPENLEWVVKELKALMPAKVGVYAVPKIELLAQPTIKEIAEKLKAKVLFGADLMTNRTGSFAVGAMQLRHFLTHLKNDCLVITPGDRADIILGVLQAHLSVNYPQIAGIVLTGGLEPEESIAKLIEGLSAVVPVIAVQEGTFEVVNKIGNIKPVIYALNRAKIDATIAAFQAHIPGEELMDKLLAYESKLLTPRMFQFSLIQKARKARKKIVLPEGTDPRILEASARLMAMDLVDLVLLGDPGVIRQKAAELGLDIPWQHIEVINPTEDPRYEDYAQTYYGLRKHKNVNLDMARDAMADVSYFGTMMIYKGDADGMVSGAMHTTQHTILPALQFIKTKPGVSVVSSVFFMCLPDRVSVFGDCAINPNPSAEELAEIAISSARSSQAFGIEPRIAMLSYSSGSSGKGVDVDRVRQATELVRQLRPDLKIEGPIQYDAAVDPLVGKSKLPQSEVAGQASVLIFPDLNTGNNTYKAVQRETGAMAIGPMLQGLNKPVNDLSRGCTVDDVFNTVVLTAIQAQGIDA
ncbi:MAG TPA: phosphate acetyltransferase [Flavobacteriaceae bacterium]|jgi:phosphate acetyltransferase|nr:phosphate acetyltransferase [Flavobacteriaceae bacterium]